MEDYRTGSLESNNYKLVYKIRRGHPYLIFLHGLAGSKEYFEDSFYHPGLKDYGILTIDFGGFGESKVFDGDYSLLTQARRISKLIEELQLSSAYLIAHSYAGPISYLLYKMIPGWIQGILLAESAIRPGPRGWSSRITSHSFEDYKEVFQGRLDNTEEFYRKVLVDKSQENLEVLVKGFKQTTPEALYNNSKELLSYCYSVDLIKKLSNLKIPVNYILGSIHEDKLDNDPIIKRLNETNVEIDVLAKSGHCMMLDNPSGFYQLVEVLLKE